jgi:hypothetical protein
MNAWPDVVGAIAESVSALAIGGLFVQFRQSRTALGLSEAAVYNDTRARMEAAAPRVEVHVAPPVWPPCGDSPSGGTPQPYPAATEWHFPRNQGNGLLLQTTVTVTNRSQSTVHAAFEGDLWESDVPDGRPRRMRPQMLLGPGEAVTAQLCGGMSVREWADVDARVRAGQAVDPAVRAVITVHDDADEGVVDVWRPYLTGTPIAEDPDRGSVWRLTPPPIAEAGGRHGDWCQQYDLQPSRRRSYWLSREDERELVAPAVSAPRSKR